MITEEQIKKITEEIILRLRGTSGVSGKDCSTSGGICLECGSLMCISKNPKAVETIISSGADRIGAGPGITPVGAKIASLIDHTLLKPEATISQIRALCGEAIRYKFASVCVNPWYVSFCRDELKNTGVKVCTVVGFPLGATTTVTKAFEARDAIAHGADEIDMVINIGALKSKDFVKVEDDIRAVVLSASNQIVKVIIETSLLTDDEKIKACQLAKSAGADFVKTSTGFAKGGATVHDIELMRRAVGPSMGIKASGGIRSTEQASELIRAGATRIGASASIAIVKGERT